MICMKSEISLDFESLSASSLVKFSLIYLFKVCSLSSKRSLT